MPRARYAARQGGARNAGRILVAPRNDTPLKPAPVTRTTLVEGMPHAICPTCKHDVRVTKARFSDAEDGRRYGDPVFCAHTPDGTKTIGIKTTPCAGSNARAPRHAKIYKLPVVPPESVGELAPAEDTSKECTPW